MLRKHLYLFFLALSLVLWSAAALRYSRVRKPGPQASAALISTHLAVHQQEVKDFLARYPEIIARAGSGLATTTDIDRLSALDAALFIYRNDTLRSWSTNNVLPEGTPAQYTSAGRITRQDGTVYWAECLPVQGDNAVRIIVFYPILIAYPFENDYLTAHFSASGRIPATAEIRDTASAGAIAFLAPGGQRAGYLYFSPQDTLSEQPDVLVTWLALLAAIALIASVQLISISLVKRQLYTDALLFTIDAVLLLRGLLYVSGLPFELDEWPVFSPQWYASNSLLPSLGDLLLNAAGALWIAIVISRLWPAGNARKKFWPMHLKAGGIVLAMVVATYATARIVASVVLNSNISFDVAHYYAVDPATITGLFTICVIISAVAVCLHTGAIALQSLYRPGWVRWMMLPIACLVIYVSGWPADKQAYWLCCGWLLLLMAGLELPRLRATREMFAPPVLFWMVFFCGSGTFLLQHYNDAHERDARRSYAERIVARRDDAMEWAFNGIQEKIAHDTAIAAFVSNPSSAARTALADRFSTLYLNNELNNYGASLFIFNEQQQPLFNDDSVSYASLLERENSAAMPANAPHLFYFESAADEHDYLGHIPVTDSTGKTIAYVFLDLAQKKTANETVLPELLQPSTINKAQKEAGYQSAVYAAGRLLSQSGDYPFAFYLEKANAPRQEWSWGGHGSYSVLHYQPDALREAVVVRKTDTRQADFTLFSYLFGLMLGIGLLAALYRYSLLRIASGSNASGRFLRLTLRQRIQLSMLGVVLVSFLIIAVTTITFFRQRYDDSNRRTILASLQVAERAVEQYLLDDNAATASLANTATDLGFRKFIGALARTQNRDIMLYDADGKLIATSQEDIYTNGIQARIMRPEALSAFRTEGPPLLIRQETIGKLEYVSSYVPLRATGGRILGYINIPFFSSQKEVDAQVSNILVALINLYAFIFLLSSLLAVLTTRWLTSTLAVIIGQFNRLGLAGNELLEWPYEDEIGVLVREYNKMVRKVEESAAMLAQSEREGAWREMARQVAHEIKNPLTPMKLNIQYLQTALRNDHPNLLELTKRVADSMLEQIDNLNYIASEFSNFAKLPEAKTEEIVLNDLLENAAALYSNEPGIELRLVLPEERVSVFSDRSQVNRICTNLLQNAVQAIPTDVHDGIITLSLTEEPGLAVIAVQDNGTGITEEVGERLFKPYFTTKTSGTGLGLAMTRKMVELWKGNITYETVIGEGTTFFVRLPTVSI